MTPVQAYDILGLTPDADREAVRAAYRRLAFMHHPDRNQGSKESFARFKRVTRAYRILQAKFRLDAAAGLSGHCARCGRYAALRVSVDNSAYCTACLTSRTGRPTLPGPAVVIAGCGLAVVALVVAAALFVMYLSTDRVEYGAATLATAVAALVSLALTAVTVGYALRSRKRRP